MEALPNGARSAVAVAGDDRANERAYAYFRGSGDALPGWTTSATNGASIGSASSPTTASSTTLRTVAAPPYFSYKVGVDGNIGDAAASAMGDGRFQISRINCTKDTKATKTYGRDARLPTMRFVPFVSP